MKNTTAEQAPTTVVVPEFTGDQWAASQEFLWNQAFQAGEIRAVLEPELDALYEKLGKETVSASSLAERKERSARKEHYWQTHAQLQELKDREHKILSVLERIEAGDADPAEVIALLPKEEDDDQKMDDGSDPLVVQKADRKQSRAEKACASFLLGIYDKFDYTSAPYPRTDPRRIASGRNRTKLVSSAGINAMFAESAFYDATADTHGGKSRRPGKNDKYYVAASGRRIRKK